MNQKDKMEKEVREIMEFLTPIIETGIREYLSLGEKNESIKHYKEYKKEKRIAEILDEFSISANWKGYPYLIDAIKIAVNNLNVPICNGIYSPIAEKYNSTSSRVERSIRSALENSWKKVDEKIIYKWFNTELERKPTNSQFIFTIANKLRNEIC